MKRQSLETGVRRWFGDDWIKLQDELYKALEQGLLNNLDDCILGGVEVTPNGGNYDVAPGICYVGGKIAIYEGATNITLPITLMLKETPADDRLYLDGSTKPTRTDYTAATDGTLGGNLEISSTKDPRIQLPAINSNGELVGLTAKTDDPAEDDSNILATSKATNTLNEQDQTLSSRITALESAQEVKAGMEQAAQFEVPQVETLINLIDTPDNPSENTDVLETDPTNDEFILKEAGNYTISYEVSFVNEDGANRDLFLRVRDEASALIDDRPIFITGSGGGDDGNANVSRSFEYGVTAPNKNISFYVEASGDNVTQAYFKCTVAKITVESELPPLDPNSTVETDGAGSLIAVNKETGHNLPKSDSPTLDDSNTLATSKAVRDATRGSSTEQVQIGNGADASGINSTAVGSLAAASNDSSTALGRRAIASMNFSTALGYLTDASGLKSTAVGQSATASGSNSIALGNGATASSDNSTALGRDTQASGDSSTALGKDAIARNDNSTALGRLAQANGLDSTALGYNAEANGNNSTALGRLAQASVDSSTALGYNSVASGAYSIALGNGATADGINSIALGYNTNAQIIGGNSSTALGDRAKAEGEFSTALGYFATASGSSSTALGRSAQASESNSIALGRLATASGSSSTALGQNSISSESNSFALGTFAIASGSQSTALGYNANVSETNTMVLGTSTTTVRLGSGNAVTSDERDKIDIADNELGLDFVKQIKTRKWRGNNRDRYWVKEKVKGEEREGVEETEEREVFKTDEKGERVYDDKEHAKGSKAGKRWHRGIIAQEMLELVDPMEFSGVKDTEVNNPDITHQEMSFAYDQLIAPMIKAIQELSAKTEELFKRIEQLEK